MVKNDHSINWSLAVSDQKWPMKKSFRFKTASDQDWPLSKNDRRSKMTNGQKWTYQPQKILLLLIFTDFISISELFLPIKLKIFKKSWNPSFVMSK